MRYISKAIRQPGGELLLKPDTQALLYRAVADLAAQLSHQPAAPSDDVARAVRALQKVLGEYPGQLPAIKDLLGDPARELLARNLLKG